MTNDIIANLAPANQFVETGDLVIVLTDVNRRAGWHGHGFMAGETIRAAGSPGRGDQAFTRPDGSGTVWYLKSHEFALIPDEAPERPLIHFDDEKAGRDRSKARAAASLAISKANKDPETNLIMSRAVKGESVDAYALNAAVLDAMRSATTRYGQSTARRSMAKQFAHLGHIVQAVLENHADNLPAYAPGERSRYVAEAKEELAEAERALRGATTEIEALTAALNDATAQRERMAKEAEELRADRDERDEEIARLHKVIAYARTVSGPTTSQRIAGYADGVGATPPKH